MHKTSKNVFLSLMLAPPMLLNNPLYILTIVNMNKLKTSNHCIEYVMQ